MLIDLIAGARPNFNSLISEIEPISNGYLDMTINMSNLQFTDGNHLHKTSGKIVSKKIAKWISDLKE